MVHDDLFLRVGVPVGGRVAEVPAPNIVPAEIAVHVQIGFGFPEFGWADRLLEELAVCAPQVAEERVLVFLLAAVALAAGVIRVDVGAKPLRVNVVRGLVELPEPLAGFRVQNAHSAAVDLPFNAPIDLHPRVVRLDLADVEVVRVVQAFGPKRRAGIVEDERSDRDLVPPVAVHVRTVQGVRAPAPSLVRLERVGPDEFPLERLFPELPPEHGLQGVRPAQGEQDRRFAVQIRHREHVSAVVIIRQAPPARPVRAGEFLAGHSVPDGHVLFPAVHAPGGAFLKFPRDETIVGGLHGHFGFSVTVQVRADEGRIPDAIFDPGPKLAAPEELAIRPVRLEAQRPIVRPPVVVIRIDPARFIEEENVVVPPVTIEVRDGQLRDFRLRVAQLDRKPVVEIPHSREGFRPVLLDQFPLVSPVLFRGQILKISGFRQRLRVEFHPLARVLPVDRFFPAEEVEPGVFRVRFEEAPRQIPPLLFFGLRQGDQLARHFLVDPPGEVPLHLRLAGRVQRLADFQRRFARVEIQAVGHQLCALLGERLPFDVAHVLQQLGRDGPRVVLEPDLIKRAVRRDLQDELAPNGAFIGHSVPAAPVGDPDPFPVLERGDTQAANAVCEAHPGLEKHHFPLFRGRDPLAANHVEGIFAGGRHVDARFRVLPLAVGEEFHLRVCFSPLGHRPVGLAQSRLRDRHVGGRRRILAGQREPGGQKNAQKGEKRESQSFHGSEPFFCNGGVGFFLDFNPIPPESQGEGKRFSASNR